MSGRGARTGGGWAPGAGVPPAGRVEQPTISPGLGGPQATIGHPAASAPTARFPVPVGRRGTTGTGPGNVSQHIHQFDKNDGNSQDYFEIGAEPQFALALDRKGPVTPDLKLANRCVGTPPTPPP